MGSNHKFCQDILGLHNFEISFCHLLRELEFNRILWKVLTLTIQRNQGEV